MALSDASSQRNATMIAHTNCDFGVLKKKGYDISVKIYTEKQRRQNINFILEIHPCPETGSGDTNE